ncbi:MAG TPA: hypothetical protein VHC48_12530, partial [Puia sp.]|nr:hypothetical protein [Puia sp.]
AISPQRLVREPKRTRKTHSSMEIDVNQKKISIGDKYRIFVDGQETYLASRRLFQLLPEVNLFKVGEERAKMTINKRLSWFKARYDITRWDNSILQFRTKSLWELQYECQVGADLYAIYGHRGRKYSIFKNDTISQVIITMVIWLRMTSATLVFNKKGLTVIGNRNSEKTFARAGGS